MIDALHAMHMAEERWGAGKPVLTDGVMRYGPPLETYEPRMPCREDKLIDNCHWQLLQCTLPEPLPYRQRRSPPDGTRKLFSWRQAYLIRVAHASVREPTTHWQFCRAMGRHLFCSPNVIYDIIHGRNAYDWRAR